MAKAVERANKTIEGNSKTKEDREYEKLSPEDKLRTDDDKLKKAKEELATILEAGKDREAYANKEKEILDLEDRRDKVLKSQGDKLEDQLKQQLELWKLKSMLTQNLEDESKMTLEEAANSPSAMNGDRDKARRAQNFKSQAEQARLRGDAEGQKFFTNQANEIINGADPSKMGVVDRSNLMAADYWKGRGPRS